MAREATTDEKALMRSDNQWSELYMYVYPPPTVYTARVGVPPASLDQVRKMPITGGSGTIGNVKPGMTAYIGSSSGGRDKGRVRVRSIDGSFIYIGETSVVQWAEGQYITIVDQFDLWPIKLAFNGGVWNIEGEVSYTDQNDDMDPVPVMGPTFGILILDGTGVAEIQPSASGSWAPGSTVASYSWAAPGASYTANLTTHTPTIRYNAAGVYRIACTVTAANSKARTRYIYVKVYLNNLTEAVTQSQFKLTRLGGTIQDGWGMDVQLWDQATLAAVQDRSMVVLFAKSYYGGTQADIGPIAGYERVIFEGWIEGRTIQRNPEQGSVKFKCHGPAWWLNRISNWPVSLMDTESTPTDWMHVDGLTIDKAIAHIANWRSTMTNVIDVYPSGDTRRAYDTSANIGKIYEQIKTITEQKIGAPPICDRYGRMFFDIDAQLVPVDERGDIPVVMEITGDDWEEEILFDRREYDLTALLETAAFFYDGAWQGILSRSPGNSMLDTGDYTSRYNLIASSQAQLNELTGLLAAKENNPIPNVPVRLAQFNPLVDIAPRQYVTTSMAAADTPAGLTWESVRLIPRGVEMSQDDSGMITVKLETELETSGPAGITVEPPPMPEDTNPPPDLGDPSYDPMPSLIPWTPHYVPVDPPVEIVDCDDPSAEPTQTYRITPDIPFLTNETPESVRTTLIYYPCKIRPAGSDAPSRLTIEGSFQYLSNGEWKEYLGTGWLMQGINPGQAPILTAENLLDPALYAGYLAPRYNPLNPAGSLNVEGFRLEIPEYHEPASYDHEWIFSTGTLGWVPYVGFQPSGIPPLAPPAGSSVWGTAWGATGLMTYLNYVTGNTGWCYFPNEIYAVAGCSVVHGLSSNDNPNINVFGMWLVNNEYPLTLEWYYWNEGHGGDYTGVYPGATKRVWAFAVQNGSGPPQVGPYVTRFYKIYGFESRPYKMRWSLDKMTLRNVCPHD